MRAVTSGGTGRPLGETAEGTGAKLMSLEDHLWGQTYLFHWRFRQANAVFIFLIQTVQF